MKIAIIGGIGSGKSEVLRVAREMGLAALSADEINAELLGQCDYISEIAKIFPTAVEDGKIVRQKLAEIVFSDEAELKKLNAIAHPRILKVIQDNANDPLIVEMPLLIEIGAEGLFDEIVLVYTPLSMRIERLKHRGMNKAEAERRIGAQADEQSLKAVATRVIDNSGSIDELRENAKQVFNAILA